VYTVERIPRYAMSEPNSSKRARHSSLPSLAFLTALVIGTLTVLGCTILLGVSTFGTAPSIYWKLCFGGCVLALGVLVLGHVALAWNCYGFDGSISVSVGPHRRLQFRLNYVLTSLFWLLILSGFLSAALGFTERTRFVVLLAFAVVGAIGVVLTPLFHVRLVLSVRRGIWGEKP
jgi:hypothetical protein